MRTPLFRVLGVAALVALPLAACGGDDDEPSGSDTTDTTDAGSGDGAITVDALDALRFEPGELTAPAGSVTFELVNDGSLPHTFVIEDYEDDLELSVSGGGDTDDGSIELEAGDYVFYCDIPGHRGAGMEGTLTVE